MSLYWVTEGVDHEKRLRNGALDNGFKLVQLTVRNTVSAKDSGHLDLVM